MHPLVSKDSVTAISPHDEADIRALYFPMNAPAEVFTGSRISGKRDWLALTNGSEQTRQRLSVQGCIETHEEQKTGIKGVGPPFPLKITPLTRWISPYRTKAGSRHRGARGTAAMDMITSPAAMGQAFSALSPEEYTALTEIDLALTRNFTDFIHQELADHRTGDRPGWTWFSRPGQTPT